MTGRSDSTPAGACLYSAKRVRAMGNATSLPSLRPIQFACAFFLLWDQSIQERLFSRRSAYSVMRKNHWERFLSSTAVPQRSHSPPITCSFESTVLQEGHQLTGASFLTASPAL